MLRLNAAIIFTILCTCSVIAQSTVQDYVNKYHKTAITEMERTGIPASVLLASGILESYIGNSQLALQANNHFNIKCQKNWSGEFFYQWEQSNAQKPSCYRVYEIAEESYLEFANYLMAQSTLSGLLMYNVKGYKQWSSEMARLKLSARLSDANQMILLIEEFDLAAFDNQKPKKESYKYSARKIHNVHGLRAVVALSEDTPLGIATEFRIPYRKILKYNDLEEGSGFKANQFVFLEAKRTTGDIGTNYHEMRAGETIYDIAQLYGIKLKSLLKFNHVNLEDRIASGERVYLQEDAPIRPRLVGERPIQRTKVRTRPSNQDVAVNDKDKDAPGINDKVKYRPQRKPALPQVVERKKRKEEKEVEKEKEEDNMGYIVQDPKIKVEKPRIIPVEPSPTVNKPRPEPGQPGRQLENIPGKNAKSEAQSKLEGAPVPIIPTDANVSDKVPGKPGKPKVIDQAPVEDNPLLEKPEPKEGYHIVGKNETLYSIAVKYNKTVEAIKYWNKLKTNELEVGQELRVTGGRR